MTEGLNPKPTIDGMTIVLKIDGKLYPVPINHEFASLILTFLRDLYPEGIPIVDTPIEGADII